MAVVDENYRFLHVGHWDCDSSVFKRLSFWTSVLNNKVEIPTESNVSEIQNHNMLLYYFVGDEAFALHKHLLCPFVGLQLSAYLIIEDTQETRAEEYRLIMSAVF